MKDSFLKYFTNTTPYVLLALVTILSAMGAYGFIAGKVVVSDQIFGCVLAIAIGFIGLALFADLARVHADALKKKAAKVTPTLIIFDMLSLVMLATGAASIVDIFMDAAFTKTVFLGGLTSWISVLGVSLIIAPFVSAYRKRYEPSPLS